MRFYRCLVWLVVLCAVLVCPLATATAQLYQGDGKDYVLYVNPTLWVWAKENNTTVTVRRLDTGAVLGTQTIAAAGEMVKRDFTVNQIRVQADKPVFVATGVVGTGTNNDAYGTYLLSENGSRIGRSFEGYTRSEVLVACQRDASSTTPPSVELIDVTDRGTANDDSVTLGLAQATFSNTDVIYWYRNNFDDDQIRVRANLACAVLVGHRLRTNPADDFSYTPPSFDPRDEGRSVGHRFFTYAHAPLTIIATEDNTTITIRDLSDGDDNRTLTLNRKQFFTTRPAAQTYNGYSQISPNPANLIDDDFLDISANKPIVVYVGPTTSDVNEHSIFAESVPRGNGKQEAYCFIQNGGASDFQIFAQNSQTQATVTTMAGGANDTSILQRIGPGGAAWSGPAAGPVWWQSAAYRFELVHIEADAPFTALCGDFDQASWQSFLPFYAPNRAPQIAANSALTRTIAEGQNLNITFTGSDLDGDTSLTWTISPLPAGATIAGTGLTRTFDWTPNFTQAGTYQVQLSLRDSGVPSRTTTITLTIIVTDVNRAPSITSTPPTTATEDSLYSYKPTATDPDPNTTFTWRFAKDANGADIAPQGATINPNTGEISWTPGDADANKEFDFAIEVCDNATPPACTKQSWKTKVTNVNDPPSITSTPPNSGRDGSPYRYKPTVTDPDTGSTFTWRKKSGPAGVSVDPNTGEVAWTPDASDAQAGSREIEIEVCDNATPPACVLQKWTVNVSRTNQAPSITSTAPDKAFVGQDLGYTPTATDPDPNSVLTWRFVKDASGANIAPQGATIDPNTGKITWTPSANDAGKDIDFAIEVCDNATPPLCTTQRFRTRVHRPCQVDADCPTSEICSAKTCRPAGCSNQSISCAAEQFCRDGQCLEDICKKGTLTCTAPQFCRPGDPACIGSCAGVSCASDERCRGGACAKDPCNGISCQGGKVCAEGQCVTEHCNQANACKHGRLCRSDLQICQEDLCKSITCPQGQLCKDGQCGVDIPCAYDSDCGGEAVCIAKLCKPAGCYKTGCKQGERCKEGVCVPDPCAGITCPNNGSICRPSDGVCVRVCRVVCARGEVCLEGLCAIDPCSVVTCAAGSRCVLGKCLLDGCFSSPNEKCKAQRACSVDGCVDDLCKDLSCPIGQICIQGQCQPPSASTEGNTETSNEGNTETSNETSNETSSEGSNETSSEGSTETSSESPTEGGQETSAETANESTTQEEVQDSVISEPTVESQETNASDKADTQDQSNTDNAGAVGGGCSCQQADPWLSWSFFFLIVVSLAFRRKHRIE